MLVPWQEPCSVLRFQIGLFPIVSSIRLMRTTGNAFLPLLISLRTVMVRHVFSVAKHGGH